MDSNIMFEVIGAGNPSWEIYEKFGGIKHGIFVEKSLLINAGLDGRDYHFLTHESCAFAILRIKKAAGDFGCSNFDEIRDFVDQALPYCLAHKNGKPIYDVHMRMWIG